METPVAASLSDIETIALGKLLLLAKLVWSSDAVSNSEYKSPKTFLNNSKGSDSKSYFQDFLAVLSAWKMYYVFHKIIVGLSYSKGKKTKCQPRIQRFA